MKFANISLGRDVEIDPSTSINNVVIGDKVRIAKRCSIYGSPENPLELGPNSYVGMNSVLNGFSAKLTIGKNVSISQFVNIMVDSGPNASPGMMRIFPIVKGPVTIGNDSWIGSGATIMPNVTLGEYCVVAAHSYVNKSFPAFSVIGGCPAKLIRTFTDEEKATMLDVENKSLPCNSSSYEDNYLDLPFEDALRKFRFRNLLTKLREYPHKRIIEIGPGSNPLFSYFSGFERMTIIEPGKNFAKIVRTQIGTRSDITLINDTIENISGQLGNDSYDLVIIGGFLHEIDNPDAVLSAVRVLCSDDTVVYTYVPNAQSFHRILAFKMGLIENVFQKSGHDELFKRQSVFDIESFKALMRNQGFKVIDSGSYFIKPFTHDQMKAIIDNHIIDNSCLEGLDKMVEYLPGMGSELWFSCKKDDKIS